MELDLKTPTHEYESDISWITDLISDLSKISKPLSLKAAKDIFDAIICSPEEALKLGTYDPETYTRNRIFRNDAVEAMLFTWQSGQASPLHNHKGSLCAIRVLAGELTEVQYERTFGKLFIPSRVSKQLEGEVSAVNDEDVHQVANAGDTPLITLHLYSPPQKNPECFPHSQSLLQNAKKGKNVGVL